MKSFPTEGQRPYADLEGGPTLITPDALASGLILGHQYSFGPSLSSAIRQQSGAPCPTSAVLTDIRETEVTGRKWGPYVEWDIEDWVPTLAFQVPNSLHASRKDRVVLRHFRLAWKLVAECARQDVAALTKSGGRSRPKTKAKDEEIDDILAALDF